MNISKLSVQTLRKAADLKEKIVGLEKQLGQILGSSTKSVATKTPKKRRGMSAAGRAKIRAAQKLRWSKVKAAKPSAKAKPAKKRRAMSAAAKAKISAAAKARWAKVKAAGKKTL
jgi:hypothetical protein